MMVNRPAGFWIRLGANLLDGLLITIAVFIIGALIGLNADGRESYQGIINLLYSLLLPVLWYGYTVGKRICGVRIAKMDGSKVGIGTMLLRTIVSGFVYVITLGIGLIVSLFMVVFRQDKRSLHDMIANTYVTYDLPEEMNPYEQ